jgi:hypothetical protein
MSCDRAAGSVAYRLGQLEDVADLAGGVDEAVPDLVAARLRVGLAERGRDPVQVLGMDPVRQWDPHASADLVQSDAVDARAFLGAGDQLVALERPSPVAKIGQALRLAEHRLLLAQVALDPKPVGDLALQLGGPLGDPRLEKGVDVAQRVLGAHALADQSRSDERRGRNHDRAEAGGKKNERPARGIAFVAVGHAEPRQGQGFAVERPPDRGGEHREHGRSGQVQDVLRAHTGRGCRCAAVRDRPLGVGRDGRAVPAECWLLMNK